MELRVILSIREQSNAGRCGSDCAKSASEQSVQNRARTYDTAQYGSVRLRDAQGSDHSESVSL